MEELNYPVRINKYLAAHKYSTRRGADDLIQAGKVTINGRLAQLGDKVSESDVVAVDEVVQKEVQKSYVYYAFNKPIGIMTHGGAAEGKQDIGQIINISERVFPIGRLDQDSHGLILLTNDGRVTDRLLNPKYDHEKEYWVKVRRPLRSKDLTRLAKGVKIEDGITKPAVVEGEEGAQSVSIALTEGKRHQIKRMITALGNEVEDLKRIRIMNIKLGDLKPGQYRKLAGRELKSFLSAIDL